MKRKVIILIKSIEKRKISHNCLPFRHQFIMIILCSRNASDACNWNIMLRNTIVDVDMTENEIKIITSRNYGFFFIYYAA